MTPFDDFFYLVNSILLGEEPYATYRTKKYTGTEYTEQGIEISFSVLLLSGCVHFRHLTIEDFILLIGTLVAFIAFVLWCCFPISPKENSSPPQEEKYSQYKKTDHYSNG